MNDDPHTYAFQRPNPTVAASKRQACLFFVVLAPLVLIFSQNITSLIIGGGFVLFVCLFRPLTTALKYRFAKGVVVDPDSLLIRRWLTRTSVYPWQDVASVSVVTGEQLPAWRRRIKAFLGSNDINGKHVEVRLRRFIRRSLLFGGFGTRGFGPPTMNRTVGFFLASPEAFVEDAQRRIQQQQLTSALYSNGAHEF